MTMRCRRCEQDGGHGDGTKEQGPARFPFSLQKRHDVGLIPLLGKNKTPCCQEKVNTAAIACSEEPLAEEDGKDT